MFLLGPTTLWPSKKYSFQTPAINSRPGRATSSTSSPSSIFGHIRGHGSSERRPRPANQPRPTRAFTLGLSVVTVPVTQPDHPLHSGLTLPALFSITRPTFLSSQLCTNPSNSKKKILKVLEGSGHPPSQRDISDLEPFVTTGDRPPRTSPTPAGHLEQHWLDRSSHPKKKKTWGASVPGTTHNRIPQTRSWASRGEQFILWTSSLTDRQQPQLSGAHNVLS